MQLDTEQIVVLAATAIAVAPLVWALRRSHQNRNSAPATSPSGNVEAPTPTPRREA